MSTATKRRCKPPSASGKSKLDRYAVKFVLIDSITPSPENDEIYGPIEHDDSMDNLIDSMRRKGMEEPILLTADRFILSGHRRHYAAKHLGWKQVPVRVRPDIRRIGNLEYHRELIEYNPQRVKTVGSILREALLRDNDAADTYAAIRERREASLTVDADFMTVSGEKEIEPIGRKQQEFLAAVQRVLEALRPFCTSFFLYKYMYVSNNYLYPFTQLISCLWSNEITPIFIFDGKHKINKTEEMKKRKDRFDATEKEVVELEKAISFYLENGTISPILTKHSNLLAKKAPKTFLRKQEPTLNIPELSEKLERMKKQLIKVTPEILADLKKLFTLLQVQFIVAHGEGEQLCYTLYKQNKVKAVVSGDSDLLAMGCNYFISNINTLQNTFDGINLGVALKELKFSQSQFLDFCIMCGTDFNTNVKGMGPVGCYSSISKYKTVQKVKEVLDKTNFDCLNYSICHSIFTEQKEDNELALSFEQVELLPFKRNELSEFFFTKNMDQDCVNTLETSFKNMHKN